MHPPLHITTSFTRLPRWTFCFRADPKRSSWPLDAHSILLPPLPRKEDDRPGRVCFRIFSIETRKSPNYSPQRKVVIISISRKSCATRTPLMSAWVCIIAYANYSDGSIFGRKVIWIWKMDFFSVGVMAVVEDGAGCFSFTLMHCSFHWGVMRINVGREIVIKSAKLCAWWISSERQEETLDSKTVNQEICCKTLHISAAQGHFMALDDGLCFIHRA